MGKRVNLGLDQAFTGSVLLLGLLVGTTGLAFAYWQAQQSLKASIGPNFQELARLGADKVTLVLMKEIQGVERLSERPEVRKALIGGRRLPLDQPSLKQLRAEQLRYFRSWVLVDREGRLVGGLAMPTPSRRYSDQPWWRAVVEQRRPWAGDFTVDEQGHRFWEVAVPVMGEDGSVQGVVKAAVDADEIFAVALRTRIGRTGHLMLLSGDGHVVVCPFHLPSGHSRLEAAAHDVLRRDPSNSESLWQEVHRDTHGANGGIVGVAPVILSRGAMQAEVWQVLIQQDPKETYAPLLPLMGKLAGFWFIAVGVVAYALARLARRIIGPLQALITRLKSLGEGAPPVLLDAEVSTHRVEISEITSLTAGFNRLVERLQAAAEDTRRSVDELERSGEHYRMLWNHSADAKLIVDEAAIIRDVNRRTEIKLSRQAGELIGTGAAGLFLESDRVRLDALLCEIRETGKGGMIGDMRVPTSGGATLVMELDMVPVEIKGESRSFLLQLSDSTERKQLEAQLLRSERLASLSQFASMFAHDIRNPLAGIKKALELLASRTECYDRESARLLNDLQVATDLLLGMINDMLDVYQESYSGLPLVTSDFSVQVLLEEIVSLLQPEADAKGVHFRLDLPERGLMMAGDRRRLQRVGINLVHNALKYSPAGGRVTISAGPAGSLDPQQISGDGLSIQVLDEGPGLDPRDLPYLFDLFFRKKDGLDLRIGRGLGLHFCKLVVEAHGGVIRADHRAEGGAVFSVVLPVAKAMAR